jgi:DNA polymerase-1
MQNLPSNSKWGKTIKNCFTAPEGWLFAGADFSSLEDKIGAILSGDPNKTKEFTEGFDGHCVRCASFFPEELLERGIVIDENNVDSVNSIKGLAEDLRNLSKPVSFLKQYGGGASKIQKVLKCSTARSHEISDTYDKLYSGLAEFSASNERLAKQHGYIELAFGLQLKTPRINAKDSGVQSAEARSSSNAATQSYGMLMNRAFIEFQQRIERDGMRNDVRICNTIHDALYCLVREKPEVVKWVNDNLIECMEWQEDPKLQSAIKIGAEVDFGYDWAHQYTLKNNKDLEYVKAFCEALKSSSADEMKQWLKDN